MINLGTENLFNPTSTQPNSENNSLVTKTESGVVKIFGESIDSQPVHGGLLLEVSQEDANETLETILKVIASDKEAGKTWQDIDGLVVDMITLRQLVLLGIVSNQDLLAGTSDTATNKVTTHFNAQALYQSPQFGSEPAIPINFQKRLVIMPDKNAVETAYGFDRPIHFATLSSDDKIL